MTFNSPEHAFNVETGININPDNSSSLIGLSDTNYLSQLLSGSSYPNYLTQPLLDDDIITETYAQNTPINYTASFGIPANGYASGPDKSVDGFGLQTSSYSAATTRSFSSSPSTSTASTNDWFSANFLDQQLINKTRDLAADGQLNRNDMIAIFRDAEDDSIIDANEYKDLQTIVNNANYFKMDDYVRVLSSKVVFGTVANTNYQGQALGNLYAGSSSTQMEKLINKWFFGSDRPSTPYTYKFAEGSLFQNGISYQDVSQGLVGDCYFLAGLAETAIHSPSTIQSMFIDNGDQTYTVRFYNNGVADYVTVDRYLPVDSVNDFIYANQAGAKWGKYDEKSNELWVALAEKAYAQINESGWINQDNTNSYAGINGGWDTDAIRHITGTNAVSSRDFNLDSIVKAYSSGNLRGFSSKASGIVDSIVTGHVYVVVDYNSATQQFTLFNPWGTEGGWLNGKILPGFVTASIDFLRANFSQWSYTA
ncbi:C2 family cysteine protease [Fortiea contorta]|uniref:C2 family cysteine protease n=1 Tax=Fortiea contorta TaxID=1892405 RepID=UPI000346087D|nr:C2 family cysteine protease [Fortiea contorta]